VNFYSQLKKQRIVSTLRFIVEKRSNENSLGDSLPGCFVLQTSK